MKKVFNIFCMIAMWVVWAVVFYNLFIYRIFLSDKDLGKIEINLFLMGAMLVLNIVLCIFIRWFLIPKTRNKFFVLVLLVIGVSVGNALSFYGYFLFPQHQDIFFYASLIMVLQFIPIYKIGANKALGEESSTSLT